MEKSLNALKIPFVRTQVGDRHVIEALRDRKWKLGEKVPGILYVVI